ncbi:MAG: hypothetical protein ACO32J_02000 [Phycisphaerales bacterium]
MRISTLAAAAFAAGMAASASATITGNAVFGDSYIVSDGGRTYSVLDVYIKSNNANDVVASVYGVSAHKAEWVQQQNRDFMHSNNSSWNPNNVSGAAWDSFVTAGMRNQLASEYGATPIALTADPGFSNFNTANAKKVVGPATGNGPGWFPAAGANPATNPYASFGNYNGQSGSINTAKNGGEARLAGNGIAAGSSLDNMFMIGRFTIDITDALEGDFTMALKFAMTVVSDGVTRSGSTNAAFRVDQSLTFANTVPSPGAVALLGLSALVSGRRRD